MRVALLYSGLPRMWQEALPTHRPLFPGAQTDVFAHFWDTIDTDEKARLIAALSPALYQFEAPAAFHLVDRYEFLSRDNINVPSRLISQYSGWQRVGTLFAPYAPLYDVVVRIRTDLHFHRPLRIDLDAIARRQIEFVGYQWTETPAVLFDAFALGAPGMMLHFHMLLSRVWDYATQVQFNPELLLTTHMNNYPRQTKARVLTELPFFIRRPHMAGWPVERCLQEGPGVAKWRDPEIHKAHLDFHAGRMGQAGIDHVNRFRAQQLGLPSEPADTPSGGA